MSSNLSTVLSASIVVSDATLSPPPQIVVRSLNSPTLAGTTVFYDPFLQAASGGTTVTLPAATCFIGYVKNLSSATNLTVAWTAVGASGSSSMLLLPGGVFIYFQPATSGGGFTAMTVTAASGTCSCEVLVGA